jgi:hypothetical protein
MLYNGGFSNNRSFRHESLPVVTAPGISRILGRSLLGIALESQETNILGHGSRPLSAAGMSHQVGQAERHPSHDRSTLGQFNADFRGAENN